MIHIWGGKKKQKMHDLFSFFPPVHYGHTYSKSSQHTLKPWNSLQGVQWQRVCLEVRKLRLHEIKLPPRPKNYISSCDHEPKIHMKSYNLNKWSRLSGGCEKKRGATQGKALWIFHRYIYSKALLEMAAEALWHLWVCRSCLKTTKCPCMLGMNFFNKLKMAQMATSLCIPLRERSSRARIQLLWACGSAAM